MSDKFSSDNDSTIIGYLNQASRVMQIYDSEKEDFNCWLNRFECVADLISIPKYQMGKVFLKMVNNNVRERIQIINPAINLSKLPYQKIIAHYLRFFSPNEDYLHRRRFKFRKQYNKESIEEYANRLLKIYNKCYKIYQSVPEEELCVQFIKGIRDNHNRSFLCITRGLTFNDAVKKAIEFLKIDLMKYMVDQTLTMMNIYNSEKQVDFNVWLNEFEYVADVLGIQESEMVTFFKNMVDNKLQRSFEKESPAVSFSEISYKEIRN
ncbi:hypothetical protein M0804_015186 [Polistes exclamans]|nr:hypothetical protein M0804_015186 [Polistes exclamans]